MADRYDKLLELRYVGISPLPEAGDRGDRRIEQALTDEIGRSHSRRRGWMRRRITVGGVALPPLALLAVTATAAAATTAAVVTLSATTLFQHDPQGKHFNGDIETVLPSTVRILASVHLPDYGRVQVWGATTKPGGFCFALKLPDGDWGGLHISQDAQDGWFGGLIPGCVQTREQQILRQTPLQPGKQPNGATGQLLEPLPLETWENEVKNTNGREFAVFVGYVEAEGTATTVRDPHTGITARVTTDGSYVLAEPLNEATYGDGGSDLQVLDAAGHSLKPDYTWGSTLTGHAPGPSQN